MAPPVGKRRLNLPERDQKMLGNIWRLRSVASGGNARLISVQRRHFGTTPLKSLLRDRAGMKSNDEWSKVITSDAMVTEIKGCSYYGPFTHALHKDTQQYYDAILNGEYLVPTEGRFGATAARGQPGRLTPGTACGFEYFIAVQQVGKTSHPIGTFTGFQVVTDRPKVPIIITATTNEKGDLSAVGEATGALKLAKEDIHRNFADQEIDVELIVGHKFDGS